MKKLSLAVVAALLLTSGSVVAKEADRASRNPNARICAQIEDLLEENTFDLKQTQELTAFVRFTLNADKEIVVLSVQTGDDRLEGFVKARLNYQKAADPNLVEGRIYQVPIRITA